MCNKSKKLLILGSDFGTLDTVNEAHKMGLYVIVTDTMKTSPTRLAADETWDISTIDIDALEAKCRKEKIDGIAYGASDFNIGNGRLLCKRLGLTHYCPSDKAWEVARDKSVFKKICKKIGAPVATDYHLTDELLRCDLDKIVYPVVVKPVDLSGNRGMSYCHNETELIEAYKQARAASMNPNIIIERMLHGPEFAVNYIMADGEISLLMFLNEHNQPGWPDNYYSVMGTTSLHLKKYLDTINDKVKTVCKEAGCRDGIVWVETILDDDGNFYLLEMGYRYGGEMNYGPYRDITGFNSIKFMIEIAIGIQHSKTDLPADLNTALTGLATAYFHFAKKDAVVAVIEGLEKIAELPGVYVDFPKGVGDKTRKGANFGTIRIASNGINELCETWKFINDTLRIEDEFGEDLIVRYDDYNAFRKEYYAGLREFGIN